MQEIVPPPNVLPVKLKIPLNKCSWPETANIMGVHVKSKWKVMYDTGGYSRAEKSGKKARADVRVPLKTPKILGGFATQYLIDDC